MVSSERFIAFGKNDIRGVYQKELDEELFFFIGQGFVDFICENSDLKPYQIYLSVSKDARLHSNSLAKSLIKGITTTGANVLNLGLNCTPLGYFSEFINFDVDLIPSQRVVGALIVTASHNPPEYNGLKMTFQKSSLTEDQIKRVKTLTRDRMNKNDKKSRWGLSKTFDIKPIYIEKMINSFGSVGKGIKIVVDSGNATAGLIAPQLYREIGCQVVELYSKPDGNFPNHHPNPSDELTLDDLKRKVVESGSDFGIAFDGDSDRVGVIDSKGNHITGDKLLLIYALDIIKELSKRNESPVVVSEVKCSQVLYDTINATGARAVMCKTGHGYIKSKMKEENAILAGEMSGHIFFKDRYYGFDDAIYAGLRLIEVVAKHKFTDRNFKIEQLLTDFNRVYCSKEIRFKCPNRVKNEVFEKFKQIVLENKGLFLKEIKDIITLDGMRIVFDDGFALIRQSNTEPVFTLRFEAKDKVQCEKYQKIMIEELKKCKGNINV